MQYWRSVSRAREGIQVLQGFMMGWHIVPSFLWGKERDQCWLQAVADSLTALTALPFTHPLPKPALTILFYWVSSKTQCIMVCSFPFCLRVKVSSLE